MRQLTENQIRLRITRLTERIEAIARLNGRNLSTPAQRHRRRKLAAYVSELHHRQYLELQGVPRG